MRNVAIHVQALVVYMPNVASTTIFLLVRARKATLEIHLSNVTQNQKMVSYQTICLSTYLIGPTTNLRLYQFQHQLPKIHVTRHLAGLMLSVETESAHVFPNTKAIRTKGADPNAS